MALFFYIIIGIIQGILEWLPVSSEGQLVLTIIWIGDISERDALSMAFWLHLGTMFSVLLYYRKEWINIIDLRKEDPEKLRRFLIITTIATALIGIPIKVLFLDLIDVAVVSQIVTWIIAISLLVTGLLLHYSRKETDAEYSETLASLTLKQQILIGCAQGFTIIPGISRSGTTVSALLFSKQNSESAFRGSFLMSVPAALGSVVLDVLYAFIKNKPLIGDLNPVGILLGVVFAFIVGILTLEVLIKVARKYNFAAITIGFGSLIIIFLLLFS